MSAFQRGRAPQNGGIPPIANGKGQFMRWYNSPTRGRKKVASVALQVKDMLGFRVSHYSSPVGDFLYIGSIMNGEREGLWISHSF